MLGGHCQAGTNLLSSCALDAWQWTPEVFVSSDDLEQGPQDCAGTPSTPLIHRQPLAR
jgi:hypothetical protein